MATKAKPKDNEPEPPEDLKLNITFASTEEYEDRSPRGGRVAA